MSSAVYTAPISIQKLEIICEQNVMFVHFITSPAKKYKYFMVAASYDPNALKQPNVDDIFVKLSTSPIKMQPIPSSGLYFIIFGAKDGGYDASNQCGPIGVNIEWAECMRLENMEQMALEFEQYDNEPVFKLPQLAQDIFVDEYDMHPYEGKLDIDDNDSNGDDIAALKEEIIDLKAKLKKWELNCMYSTKSVQGGLDHGECLKMVIENKWYLQQNADYSKHYESFIKKMNTFITKTQYQTMMKSSMKTICSTVREMMAQSNDAMLICETNLGKTSQNKLGKSLINKLCADAIKQNNENNSCLINNISL